MLAVTAFFSQPHHKIDNRHGGVTHYLRVLTLARLAVWRDAVQFEIFALSHREIACRAVADKAVSGVLHTRKSAFHTVCAFEKPHREQHQQRAERPKADRRLRYIPCNIQPAKKYAEKRCLDHKANSYRSALSLIAPAPYHQIYRSKSYGVADEHRTRAYILCLVHFVFKKHLHKRCRKHHVRSVEHKTNALHCRLVSAALGFCHFVFPLYLYNIYAYYNTSAKSCQ